jgi:phosphatidylserine/phosphatidylglycerophosphate/cardiolipin synthase-like enzyme
MEKAFANNPQSYFDLLANKKASIYKVGNGDTELMHNKFCVIDYNTVITGSYNWSYKAENNFENIIIHSQDYELANQFVNEFKQIVKKYYPKTENINFDLPIDKIIKRLEIIKNLIILEEVEEIDTNTKKLKELSINEDL